MDPNKIITGKRILIVDDEKDVLDSLASLLDMCKIDAAPTFEEGTRLMEENDYDVAILDIMGVQGFDLLETARGRDIPALMLTAHGLSQENLKRSFQNGAFYFAPKEEMGNIALFVADVLESRSKGKSPLIKWFERLGGFYDRRFGGRDWREKEKDFWEKRIRALK